VEQGTATKRLTKTQVFAYAIGVWPLTLPASSLTLSTTYYSAALGLPLATLALALTLGRLYDMLADVVLGYLSDNLTTRWGRRRPWIVIGTCLFVPAVWLTLVPGPGFSPSVYAIGLFLYFTTWTAAIVPLIAHGTEISSDFVDRGRISVWNGAVGVVAILVSFAIPYLVVDHVTFGLRAGIGDWLAASGIPGGAHLSAWLHTPAVSGIAGYGRVMLTVAIITTLTAPLCVLLYVWKVPEGTAMTTRIRQPVTIAIRNPVFLRFCLGYLLIMIGYFGRFGLMAFIVAFLFGSPDLLLPMYILMFATAWLVTPLWSFLIRRLERHWCVALAAAIEVIAIATLIVGPRGPEHAWLVFVAAFLMGLPGQTLVTVPFLIAAECAEYSAWRTGREGRAVHISLISLIMKLGGVAAAVQIGAASLLGFNPAAHPNPRDVTWILELLGLYAPVALMAAGAAITLTHPLNRRRTDIIQRGLARQAPGSPPA